MKVIVEKIMTKDVIALTPSDSIYSAIVLMKEKKVRHIPIVDDDFHLVGLVSDRNIRDAAPSIFRSEANSEELKKPLSSIMRTEIITGHPLDFAEEVAAIFCENKISCLPVVKENKLVGILTNSNLLQSFVDLTGVNKPGSQIEIKMPDKPDSLYEICGIFKKRNINILSILVYPEKEVRDYKILVIRVQTMNPSIVIDDLLNSGYEIIWPNVLGQLS